ncbi:ribose-5-phosphate isomerase RpiA [Oenococcus alcoholitolerans]|uniref:ribose-5-phosphate isomerase RpiA n=1 Tax=Oenococcus alcoholitolerans TaxID=931074 RepID=UPI003F721D8F
MSENLQNRFKKMAALKAAELVQNDMIIGLGTGSTVKYLIDQLGKRVKEDKLSFIAATTSKQTAIQAESLGIKIVNLNNIDKIDLTIDGADQVDKDFNGIKGGGAALLWEKIVAVNSKRNVWIVDGSKLSDRIGSFPLPVEITPFGGSQLFKKFQKDQLNPVLRVNVDNQPVLTDSKNYIIDLHLQTIKNPRALADYLIRSVGVVEHGLFLDIVDQVIVGQKEGVKVINNPHRVNFTDNSRQFDQALCDNIQQDD